MGGKLFDLPRMPRAEYVERERDVRACLDALMPGAYRIPRFYGDKSDFGDMDVLVAAAEGWDATRDAIVRALGITQTRAVGHVYSTVFRGLQTDFFAVPERYLESTYDFMSFNDLGNFIGKLARRFDLKFGERGLCYVYRRADGHSKIDLEVTCDFARVCGFLGLEYAPWARGFASLEAMFEWVIASPYFSVAPYLDEAHEGPMKKRKSERTTVVRFVEYLRSRGVDARPAFDAREAYLPRVIAAFPEARLGEQLARERAADERASALRARFNGARVQALVPELRGAELGAFIAGLKRSVPDFEAFVLAQSEAELARAIRAFYERERSR